MDYSRILIIKPSSLGDIVHALPAAAALRRLYPAAALTWLVKPEWSEILEGNLSIDEIVILPASPHRLFQTVRRLRAKRFDLVVDLQGLLRSGLLAWLTGAPMRVGYAAAREGSWVFYTHRVPLPVAKAPWRLLDMHAVDRNLAVVASLGAEIRNPQFSIPFFPSDQLAVETWLREAGVQPGDQLVATPVLALFGPTNPVRARPYGDGHVVLRTGISCSPCEKRTCANPNQYECLTAISVTDVVETARTMLNKSEVAACR